MEKFEENRLNGNKLAKRGRVAGNPAIQAQTLEDRIIFHSFFIKIRTDDVVFCLTQNTLALSVRVCARTGGREFLLL